MAAQLVKRTSCYTSVPAELRLTMPHTANCLGCKTRPFKLSFDSTPLEILVPACVHNQAIRGCVNNFIQKQVGVPSKQLSTAPSPSDPALSRQRRKQPCLLCGKIIKAGQWGNMKHAGPDLNVNALVCGRTVSIRACCPKCRKAAESRYEKELKCLQQQTREMANVKRVADAMTLGLKEVAREARRSQQTESELPPTSQS